MKHSDQVNVNNIIDKIGNEDLSKDELAMYLLSALGTLGYTVPFTTDEDLFRTVDILEDFNIEDLTNEDFKGDK